jgi:hypothetical protein
VAASLGVLRYSCAQFTNPVLARSTGGQRTEFRIIRVICIYIYDATGDLVTVRLHAPV